MSILDIIIEYLKDNKYDGLYNPEGECACCIEDGLCPAECNIMDCYPGVKKHLTN